MNKKKIYLVSIIVIVLSAIACSTDLVGEKVGGDPVIVPYPTSNLETHTYNATEMSKVLYKGLTETFVAPTPTLDPSTPVPTATAQDSPLPRTDTHPCTGRQVGAMLTVDSYEQNNVKFWLEGTKLMTNIRWLGPFDLDENWKQISSIESHCFRITKIENKRYLQILVKSNK